MIKRVSGYRSLLDDTRTTSITHVRPSSIYRREDAVFVVAPVVVGMRLHKLYLVFLDCNRYSFSTSVSSQTTQNLLKGNLRSIY